MPHEYVLRFFRGQPSVMGIISRDTLPVILFFLIPGNSDLVYKLKHEGLQDSLHNCERSSC